MTYQFLRVSTRTALRLSVICVVAVLVVRLSAQDGFIVDGTLIPATPCTNDSSGLSGDLWCSMNATCSPGSGNSSPSVESFAYWSCSSPYSYSGEAAASQGGYDFLYASAFAVNNSTYTVPCRTTYAEACSGENTGDEDCNFTCGQ